MKSHEGRVQHTHEFKIQCENHIERYENNCIEKQFHFQFFKLFRGLYDSSCMILLVYKLFQQCHLDYLICA